MQDGAIFGKIFAGLITLIISAFGLIMVINPKALRSANIEINNKKTKVTVSPGLLWFYRIFGLVFLIGGILLFLVMITSKW